MITPATQKLLDWYKINARVLPWRDVKDAYRVWISEIMLQQTRVDTVMPYYERWMVKFGSIEQLAKAELQEVLHCWEGLGYYSRARKISECAKVVSEKYAGVFPADPQLLRELPGIGPYTADAIASFAFDQDTLPVDGNLSRVLSRFGGIDELLGSKPFLAAVRQVGLQLLPSGRSSDFNQALMDLGSGICLPNAPKCNQCPLEDRCASKQNPTARPVKTQAVATPTRTKTACVALLNQNALLVQRPEKGLLGGMWEFPAVECPPDDLDGFVKRMAEAYGLEVGAGRSIGTIKHTYTHFKLVETIQVCSVFGAFETERMKWLPIRDLDAYPMGKVDRSIARLLSKLG